MEPLAISYGFCLINVIKLKEVTSTQQIMLCGRKKTHHNLVLQMSFNKKI